MKESDLYLPVKEWLEKQGFEVFPEVQIERGSNIIDVVGINKNFVYAIELKASFGLKVIEQAVKNRFYSNRSYVAVPFQNGGIKDENPNAEYYSGRYKRIERSDHKFARRVCEMHGIGVLSLRITATGMITELEESIPAKFIRKECFNRKEIIAICDEQRRKFQTEKNITAGVKGGGHLTDYKRTILNVTAYLQKVGKATPKEIIENIEHHYRGNFPHSSLFSSIRDFEMDKFTIEKINNKSFLQLKKH
jgi:hypothetical protein